MIQIRNPKTWGENDTMRRRRKTNVEEIKISQWKWIRDTLIIQLTGKIKSFLDGSDVLPE